MILKTLHEEVIGVIGNYFGLSVQAKFSDVSEISFTVPAYDNGEPTPFYDDIQAFRIVQVDPYGLYVLEEPNTSGDGTKEVKEVSASSLEILLANKRMVLEEGTYQLYRADDMVPTSPVTIMGIVHQLAPDWIVQVDEGIGSQFRAFDETDEKLLDWLTGKAAKSFGCIFCFDSYTKTIHVVNANKDYDVLPIYLSYDNLVKQRDVSVSIRDFFTVLNVSGADPVTIHEVNPIGTGKIYNLDYFIENGDIEEPLASKWRAWQDEIALKQDYYISLNILRNSATARKTVAQAKAIDLAGERDDIKNRMSVIAVMLERPDTWDTPHDSTTREYLEGQYSDLNDQLIEKQSELDAQSAAIEQIDAEIQEHSESIQDVLDELRITSYFTENEIDVLSHYFIEDEFTDDTFAVFDVDVTGENDVYANDESAVLSIQTIGEEDLTEIDLSGIDDESIINKRIFMLNGGDFNITVDGVVIDASIVSGTIDIDKTTGAVTCSIYAGSGSYTIGEDEARLFVNANISIVSDTSTVEDPADGEHRFALSGAKLYMTRNVAQFQSYAVQKELYDYAVEQHKTIAYPACEFDIKSGNILFAKEFEAFKDALQLGCGVFVEVSDDTTITPLLLEVHFGFEDPTNFNLVFSNTFRRHDNVTTMQELLKESRQASRTLDLAKYNYGAYNRTGAESEVRTLFQRGLNAARSQILAGHDQTVTIDGAGITVRDPNDTTSYLAINNGMIAYMDESGEARMAIGKFYDTGMGQVMYGVIAPNVVGTLLAGENLVIQSTKFDGTHMYFSVDASGAKLANGVFDLYRLTGSSGSTVADKTISLNPDLGIIVGNLQRAIAYDQNGNITGVNVATSQGASTNVGTAMTISDAKRDYTNAIANLTPNFWVDLNGDVFMRGTVYATDGVFSGKVYATDGEFTGTVHATDGDFTGTIHATDGEFSGTLKAPTLSGTITADGTTGGAIKGVTLGIGGTDYNNFTVDSNGNVAMNGNITLGGNITWSSTNKPQTDVTYDSVVVALKTGAAEDGIYSKNGKIHINASMIDAGSLNADRITTGSLSASRISSGTLNAGSISTTGKFTFITNGTTYGTVGQFNGSTSIGGVETTTYGTAMYGKDNKFYTITTDYGARISDAAGTHSVYVDSNYAVMLAGGAKVQCDSYNSANAIRLTASVVYYNDSPVTLSDRNMKSDISYDMQKYEKFFMGLKPAFYHVKHGTSGRYHVGFIAPEVADSLEDNGLSTQDFAGYVVLDNFMNDDIPYNKISSLRYEEFIPLNTYMIQKLMARVEELESKLGGME